MRIRFTSPEPGFPHEADRCCAMASTNRPPRGADRPVCRVGGHADFSVNSHHAIPSGEKGAVQTCSRLTIHNLQRTSSRAASGGPALWGRPLGPRRSLRPPCYRFSLSSPAQARCIFVRLLASRVPSRFPAQGRDRCCAMASTNWRGTALVRRVGSHADSSVNSRHVIPSGEKGAVPTCSRRTIHNLQRITSERSRDPLLWGRPSACGGL